MAEVHNKIKHSGDNVGGCGDGEGVGEV